MNIKKEAGVDSFKCTGNLVTILPLVIIVFSFIIAFRKDASETAWIRTNLLGYVPNGVKVAVWASKTRQDLNEFQLVDSATRKVVFKAVAGKEFGAYGPF